MKIKKIKYIGEDMYGKNNFFQGKKLLTNGKIYDLHFEWEVGDFYNDYNVFYIYDNLEDGDNRGYELHRSDVADIRDLNLSLLDL
jgi:hypothetical protein